MNVRARVAPEMMGLSCARARSLPSSTDLFLIYILIKAPRVQREGNHVPLLRAEQLQVPQIPKVASKIVGCSLCSLSDPKLLNC